MRYLLSTLMLLATLTGCGYKGPLTLPEPPTTVPDSATNTGQSTNQN